MKTTQFLSLSALSLGLAVSASTFAIGGGGTGGGSTPSASFDDLFSEAVGDGRCNVTRIESYNSTFYIPTDPTNSNAKFNILGWGNGTGGTEDTYTTVLESLASQCVLVAAANTENSGTGEEVQDAVNQARSRYASKILSNHKVCTSGHSQGGGGSFNAANRLDADCVIAIQADTRFTTEIYGPVASDVEVIALWSEDDSLAPAGSEYFTSNTRNVEANTSILTEVETAGEDHFTITFGRGGDIGTMFRMAVKAQLSNDSAEATRFRGAFWGPSTNATVNTGAREISEVERDSGAVNTQP